MGVQIASCQLQGDRDAICVVDGCGLQWAQGSMCDVLHRSVHWRNLANTTEWSMLDGPTETAESIEMRCRLGCELGWGQRTMY